jgi:hypothetical protein
MVAMYYNLGMHKPHSSHGTMKILSSKWIHYQKEKEKSNEINSMLTSFFSSSTIRFTLCEISNTKSQAPYKLKT